MKLLYSTIGIALSSFTFLAGCRHTDNSKTETTDRMDTVAVFTLQKDTVNKQLSFPAELIPLERAQIFAKVSGYVKNIKVDIGDRVSKGQLLAVLEAPEMVANYAQASADIEMSRSKYRASLDAYKRILNASRVDGTVAAGELEKAKNQMQADSASLNASRSKTNAYAQLKDYLMIRAPFSGIVTQRNIDPGTLIGTDNTTPMLVVENIHTLRLRVPIPEAYTATNLETPSIDFTVDAQPDVTYKAKLARKAGALNLSNRTEIWEFLYPNGDNQLKSGMLATAILKLGRKASGFQVPPAAVVTNQEKRFVIRLRNGKAEWVDVRNGISMGDGIEIFGPLSEGDTLLARATDEIKPGTALVSKQLKQE
ncbi:efflux RND transporter periplasmic adaptor subunit [Olivibacter sp. SDN3]|uniref:efflux RND transporter periplasmic adaptor subunit n=1 Tax=unclassified Olivibacter TaxID=2632301 RepID=UPI001651ACEB|nr:efflux RND transporter periplasmic adaptor subunit [Olivibacter sp. SDN3]QNL50277.1 efflux RND transporter periplasmic adaptor subunit [Olivibacter sp. SDN3]